MLCLAFCASVFVYLLWRQLAISWNLAEDTNIAFRHGTAEHPENIREGQSWQHLGWLFPLPSRIKGSWQPIIIRVASVTRRGKLPVGARRQESDSQELARKSVFDNAASHSTAFLLNSIHQSLWRCRFYTTAAGANARHPRPTNLFQTAANEGCNASRCEGRLFLHAEFDYRSRSTFTDEHEGWDDYFILHFCFAFKVIHIQVLLLEAPWALIVNIIAII